MTYELLLIYKMYLRIIIPRLIQNQISQYNYCLKRDYLTTCLIHNSIIWMAATLEMSI